MRRVVICMAVLCAGVLLAPATVSAQTGIAGVVRDTTGAIMPGVTVEASSPALIEKIARGDQRQRGPVQDRRPAARHLYGHVHAGGVQDGASAPTSCSKGTFTAQVNAELQVGAMEETLTVTAESPTVDVISNTEDVRRQPRRARRHSDDPARHDGARAADSRHDGDAVRARPVQPHQPRLVDIGLHDGDRRPAREQPVRQRPVQRLLHERRSDAGAELPHRLRVGGNPEQRHPRQPGAEGRRQQVLRDRSSCTVRAAACSRTTARTP